MTLSVIASVLPFVLAMLWQRFPTVEMLHEMTPTRLENLHEGLHRPALMVIGLLFAGLSALSTVAELAAGSDGWWIPAVGFVGWLLHEAARRAAVARVDAYVEQRPPR